MVHQLHYAGKGVCGPDRPYCQGSGGTRNLVKKYGAALLCVRYRYDADRRKRYKTVEVIVDEAPWEPPPPPESRIVGAPLPSRKPNCADRSRRQAGRGIQKDGSGNSRTTSPANST